MAETKSTARKPAAKKSAAKKRPPRTRKPAVKMSPAVRELAAKIMAATTEGALSNEALGVKRHAAGELPGARSGTLDEPRPERSIRFRLAATLRSRFGCGRDDRMPFVRLGAKLEEWCRERITDPDRTDLDAEESDVPLREVVQPIESLSVLLAEIRSHPHDRRGVCAGRVGQQLAEVSVICGR